MPHVPLTPPVVELSFSGDNLRLTTGGALPGEASLQTIFASLQHEPPTALEVEAAIAHTEDLITPLLRPLAPGAILHASGPAMRELARAAGVTPQPGEVPAWHLDHAVMNRLFDRLAGLAGGIPAAHLGLPPERAFAAHVVLLRELLHHGAFRELVITA